MDCFPSKALLEGCGRVELEKAQAEANHSAVLSQVEQLQSTIAQLQQQLHICQLELEQKRTGAVHMQINVNVGALYITVHVYIECVRQVQYMTNVHVCGLYISVYTCACT